MELQFSSPSLVCYKTFFNFWAECNHGMNIYWNRGLISKSHPVQSSGFSIMYQNNSCSRPFILWYIILDKDTGMYTSIFNGMLFTVSQLTKCSFLNAFRGVGLGRIPLHLNTAGLKKPQPEFFVTGKGLKAG